MVPMLSRNFGNHISAQPAKTSKDTDCITAVTVNGIPNSHLILKNLLLGHLTFLQMYW